MEEIIKIKKWLNEQDVGIKVHVVFFICIGYNV